MTVVPHRILVVDDEAVIRELFVRLLHNQGYEVTTAENGFDGLLKLKHFLPMVIISDLNMRTVPPFIVINCERSFLEVVMQRAAELILRLLEIQSGGRYRSPELIAEDERLMDDLQNRSFPETSLNDADLAQN